MGTRLIIDGNAVYEIDDACLDKKKKREEEMRKQTIQKRNKTVKKPYSG